MNMCCQNATKSGSLTMPSCTSGTSCHALLCDRKVLVHYLFRAPEAQSLLHYWALSRCSGTVTEDKGAAAGMQKQAVTFSGVCAVPGCVQMASRGADFATTIRWQMQVGFVEAPEVQVPAAL